MGHSSRLRVIVVHNRDFADGPSEMEVDPTFASRADVENAARDVARALIEQGHDAETLALVEHGDGATAATAVLGAVRALRERAPDLVFNLCESLAGDARHEAVLPALFELAGLPYTGSGPHALGLALRKDVAKRLLVAAGVPTPEAVLVDGDDARLPEALLQLPFPLIVKPAREDASVGISAHSVVHHHEALKAQIARVRREHQQPVLVERYIDGRELYVSLLDGPDGLTALPMHEIDFALMPEGKPRIVTYDAKWDPSSDEWTGTRPQRALPLPAETRLRCEEAAKAAFRALDLRDYARIDLRLHHDGTPYVIDVNPNCDLSEGAGVSRAASFGGLAYAQLIARICHAALARHNRESTHVDGRLPKARRALPPAAAADGAPPPAERSASAGGAGAAGRAVHQGGGLRRARADRRRAP